MDRKISALKKRQNNAGVAMIVVLIVSAVVMVFCLSLLLVTYTLFAQTSRQVTQVQCKILAQSTSETLKEELKKPDSDLCIYFRNQIESGKWISEEAAKAAEEGSLADDVVSELRLTLDDGNALGDYNLSVTFTYSLNLPDDDGGGEGDEKDDQDNDSDDNGMEEGNGQNSSEDPGESNGEPAGNGTYSIKATIKCMRGNGADRDEQYYIIETIYPAVSL